jgi:hypothetical protein
MRLLSPSAPGLQVGMDPILSVPARSMEIKVYEEDNEIKIGFTILQDIQAYECLSKSRT